MVTKPSLEESAKRGDYPNIGDKSVLKMNGYCCNVGRNLALNVTGRIIGINEEGIVIIASRDLFSKEPAINLFKYHCGGVLGCPNEKSGILPGGVEVIDHTDEKYCRYNKILTFFEERDLMLQESVEALIC
ncbi:MAG: hypothetical protein WC796_06015 [Candidatus Pacearchaeota archaeon]|jgi:hypothetical protein